MDLTAFGRAVDPSAPTQSIAALCDADSRAVAGRPCTISTSILTGLSADSMARGISHRGFNGREVVSDALGVGYAAITACDRYTSRRKVLSTASSMAHIAASTAPRAVDADHDGGRRWGICICCSQHFFDCSSSTLDARAGSGAKVLCGAALVTMCNKRAPVAQYSRAAAGIV